jgi:hypothetical protein
MYRRPSTYALVVVVFAASAWLVGSGVEVLLGVLGTDAAYAADLGGLSALVAFLLMGIGFGTYVVLSNG